MYPSTIFASQMLPIYLDVYLTTAMIVYQRNLAATSQFIEITTERILRLSGDRRGCTAPQNNLTDNCHNHIDEKRCCSDRSAKCNGTRRRLHNPGNKRLVRYREKNARGARYLSSKYVTGAAVR